MAEKVNIQYKDRLFRLLFGTAEYKDNILSLYNALNGTDYSEADGLEIDTIDDAVYVKMKNDVAILIDSYLSLWEQQSSYNPNMPLRGLMYFGKLYDKYIEANSLNIYGSALVEIPTPQYVVFYNGERDIEPVTRLRLSQAFAREGVPGDFEWTAVMYNLNTGKNDGLLERCVPLRGYMALINKVRENREAGMALEKAVDGAVTYCISRGILEEMLHKHRAEVIDMCITEYNEKAFVGGIRAEGIAEGRAEERSRNLQTVIQNLVSREGLSPEEATEKAKALLSWKD